MVELVNINTPILETKRISLSKPGKNLNILNIEVNFCLKTKSNFETGYGKDYLDSTYVYFLVLNNREFQKLYKSFNSKKRMQALKNIENNNIFNLRTKHQNFYRIPLSKVLKKVTNSNNKSQYNSNSKKQYNSNVTISYKPEKNLYSNPQQETGFNSLHLLAFVDNDFKKYSTQTNSDTNYDLLLEVDSQTGKLSIPKTRRSFFIDDQRYPRLNSRPYLGPAHYHSPSNPGPDNYIGWMVGHSRGTMGPKLKSEKIPNYKIHSESFANLMPKMTAPLSNYGASDTTGQKLENFSKNFKSKIEESVSFRTLLSNSISSGQRKEQSFITKETPLTSYFRTFSSGRSHLDSNYCGSVIGIDTLNLLRSKSILGGVVDFHVQRNNRSVINDILKYFQIYHLIIKRQKIDHDFLNVNSQKTKVPNNPRLNLQPKEIISTRDTSRGTVGSALNSKASLEQIPLVSLSGERPPAHVRNLSLKDYDLFHNYDHGKYTYSVEVTFDDAVLKYILEIQRNLNRIVPLLGQYIDIADFPATYDRSGRFLYGSFDKDANRQTKAFMKTKTFNDVVSTAFSAYSKAYEFISGFKPEVESLKKQMMTANYNSKTSRLFVGKVIKLQNTILKILKKYVHYREGKNRTAAEVSLTGAQSYSTLGLLRASSNTNIIHDISNISEFLIDNAPESAIKNEIPLFENLIQEMLPYETLESSLNQEFIPSRYVDVQKSRYFIKEETTDIKRGASATTILQTKNISSQPSVATFNMEPGNTLEIMSKEDYDSLAGNQKFIFDTKISTLKSNRKNNSSLKDKPDEFFPSFLQTNNSSLTISASGFSKSRSANDQEKVFEQVLGKIIPDIDADMQSVIINSVYSSKDFKQFQETIDNTFKEQIALKKSLGVFYQNFNKYLSYNKILNRQRIEKLDYK